MRRADLSSSIEDAEAFLNRWETEAAALGWTALDLFGCDPVKPHARIDLSGLVLLLHGHVVTRMTDTEAVIRTGPGRTNKYTRRRASPEQVALWEMTTGRASQC